MYASPIPECAHASDEVPHPENSPLVNTKGYFIPQVSFLLHNYSIGQLSSKAVDPVEVLSVRLHLCFLLISFCALRAARLSS